MSMLSDANVYDKVDKEIIKDPLDMLLKRIKKIAKRWYDNKYIDDEIVNEKISKKTLDYIYTTDTNLPRCYALPKIHKNNIPYRIIVSCIGTPFYFFSKFVSNLISKSILTSQ